MAKNNELENNVAIIEDGEVKEQPMVEVEVEETDKVITLYRKIVKSNTDGKQYNDLFAMVIIAGKERKASCVLKDRLNYQFIDAVYGSSESVDMYVSINKMKDNVTGKITKNLSFTIGFEEDGFRFNIPVKPVTGADREILSFYCRSKLGLNV